MDTRISGLKHFVIYFVIVAIVAVGGWALYHFRAQLPTPASSAASYQFQGQITGIGQNDVNVFGTHILDSNPVSSDFKNPHLIKVDFDTNTKYVRTSWLAPTTDDFAKGAQPPFYVRQTNVSKSGVIGDLRNQLGMLVVVKTNADSSGKSEVTASEVDYSLPTSYTGYGFSGQILSGTGKTISASGIFFVQNSPAVFMNQGTRNVSLVISPTTKLMRLVIPKITDPAHTTNKNVPVPSPAAQVTLSQMMTDITVNKNIGINALTPVNVYASASFTPSILYYSIFPSLGK